MKNKYDDYIFRYLSDLLNENERNEFESELKVDSNLQNRFEAIRSNLKNIKQLIPADSDSVYFSNLVPKIRERMDSGRSRKIFSGTVKKAFGFGLAAVLVMIVVLQNGEDTIEPVIESVTSLFESANGEELNEFIELRYSDLADYDLISKIDLAIYSSAINEQIVVNDEDMYDHAGYSYLGLDGINDINESDEDEIYASLIDKKIL